MNENNNNDNISSNMIEFMTFTSDLQEELDNSYYYTNINNNNNSNSILSSSNNFNSSSLCLPDIDTNIILLLTCEKFEIPLISICGEIVLNNHDIMIGMWELRLSGEKIKEHVNYIIIIIIIYFLLYIKILIKFIFIVRRRVKYLFK